MDHTKYLEEYKTAILIRRTEEQLLELFKQGKMNGTVHTCIGQEFTGVAVSKYLQPDDYVVSNHRGHGHYISRTGDLKGLFAEVTGRVTGCSGGIGGSQHLYNKNFFSNGIQGGMTPIATGLALAARFQGKDAIAVAYIGDGTLGEGILYESLNISSIWNVPVLFVVENNGIAQSTSMRQTVSGTITDRGNAFGIHCRVGNTGNPDELLQLAKDTVSYVRGGKPAVLEIRTNRLHSHSKGDDNRDTAHVAELKEQDPINRFAAEHKAEYERILSEVDALIAKELGEALKDDILEDFPRATTCLNEPVSYSPMGNAPNKRGNELINDALDAAFANSEQLVMIGEDIETANAYNPGEYGGAFKVSRDLSAKYGERVRNTPISEAAIVGIGTGLALAGMRPIVEIMFGDFLTLTLDQLLQHACKFRLMYNDKVRVPLIVRTPMGGRRGYGPTHSQSIEKHFLGIPDLQVLALNHRVSPELIYKQLFKHIDTPTLVVENKTVYTQKLNGGKIPGYDVVQSDELYPTLRIYNADEEADCTILCYGGMLDVVESTLEPLFEDEEVMCDVLCPSRINPININPIVESVKTTGRLLIVEEGANVAAWGSEVIALLAEKGAMPRQVMRVGNNAIIPCSINAENKLIPHKELIINAVRQLIFG